MYSVELYTVTMVRSREWARMLDNCHVVSAPSPRFAPHLDSNAVEQCRLLSGGVPNLLSAFLRANPVSQDAKQCPRARRIRGCCVSEPLHLLNPSRLFRRLRSLTR